MSSRKEIADLALQSMKQQSEIGLGDIFLPKDSIQVVKTSRREAEREKNAEILNAYCNEIKDCTKCRLHQGRNKFVFGVGNPVADIMFIGEGPGHDEDIKGEPFVGRAGQLLDKILAAIHFDRTQVFIANIVKCRPPNNRDPQPDEMAECLRYLMRQIEIIDPTFICCLGRIAAQTLLNTTAPLNKLRGRFIDFQGRKVVVTYHPAALLRFPQYKRETWEDVQLLRREYDALFGEDS